MKLEKAVRIINLVVGYGNACEDTALHNYNPELGRPDAETQVYYLMDRIREELQKEITEL